MTGEPFTDEQRVFTFEAIGRTYLKSLYREYTPAFAHLKARSPEEEHLGLLGPIIRPVVGDTIVIHFRDNTRLPASVHPQGVLYTKDSEDAPSKMRTPASTRPTPWLPPPSRAPTLHLPAVDRLTDLVSGAHR